MKCTYETVFAAIDEQTRARFERLETTLQMSTGSAKTDDKLARLFNRFCETAETKYIDEASDILCRFTGNRI